MSGYRSTAGRATSGHTARAMLKRVQAMLLVLVAAVALSGCALFQRVDDFGKPLTIENRTTLNLNIFYSNVDEILAETMRPGETKKFVSEFSAENVQCLQGDLIARSDTVEVARIHAPCRDTTWTITP